MLCRSAGVLCCDLVIYILIPCLIIKESSIVETKDTRTAAVGAQTQESNYCCSGEYLHQVRIPSFFC